ncbi:hypothetical protein CRENBAI_008669 [Crenichthys baileyi]|uniref:Uncharacterized protein n=1 Tax=Crenichthys baileyi TaxID=28760 RepID=A0AAV9S8U4_9TELE
MHAGQAQAHCSSLNSEGPRKGGLITIPADELVIKRERCPPEPSAAPVAHNHSDTSPGATAQLSASHRLAVDSPQERNTPASLFLCRQQPPENPCLHVSAPFILFSVFYFLLVFCFLIFSFAIFSWLFALSLYSAFIKLHVLFCGDKKEMEKDEDDREEEDE